ncbi:hypothetical protein L208DRAFT_1275007, partial [Tricholoma matsutake]
LDGMVNNFNETILATIRCNMDIKFVGSGESAKVILYYITDYISKAQLKAHVAYAALEIAVCKLGECNPWDDEPTVRAKRMLQKCAHAMIAHQELSSQQVMLYLLELEDHFTSHEFKNLFWTLFKAAVNSEDPSPECYQTSDGDSKQCSQGMTSNERDEEIQDKNEEVDRSTDVDQEFLLGDVVLQSLTLWEFCAQTEKVKAAWVSEIADLEDMNLDDILMFPNKTRPTYQFKTPHEECYTYVLKVLHPTS